jgi:low affinity Fe/Cu permease
MQDWFRNVATSASNVAGSVWTFLLAVGVIAAWLITGPMFGFSDTWQLIINTGTTIVTFLMVFLIQNTQNRDAAALHAKIGELIVHTMGAHNELAAAEELDEENLAKLKEHFRDVAQKGGTKVVSASPMDSGTKSTSGR